MGPAPEGVGPILKVRWRFPLVIRYCGVVSLVLVLMAAPAFAAQKLLRVCADPDYMPYSNRAGQGFENKIAELVAKSLGDKLEYTWHSYRGRGGYEQFLSSTLDAGKCDVAISLPWGNTTELTTKPYYESSYVFIYKKSKNYDIKGMSSPVLHKLKIGFEADTPPEMGLKLRNLMGDVKPFHVADNKGESPKVMLQAVQDGTVDVMITWEPAIGYYLKDYPDLEVVRVPNSRATGSPEMYMFSMAMAVRKGNKKLKKELNHVIDTQKKAIKAILAQYNVKLYSTAGMSYDY